MRWPVAGRRMVLLWSMFAIACQGPSADRDLSGRAVVVVDASSRALLDAADPAPTFADPTPPQPLRDNDLNDPARSERVQILGPRGHADVGLPEVKGGTMPNADRVAAGMRAGFRACYNLGLASNPLQRGSVRISVVLGADGRAMETKVDGGAGLSSDTIACIRRRVERAAFGPPDRPGTTIVVPITLDVDR